MNESAICEMKYVYLAKMSCVMFNDLVIGVFSSKEPALKFLDSMNRYGPFPDTTKFRLEAMILNRPLYPIRTIVTTAHFIRPVVQTETTSWKDQGMS